MSNNLTEKERQERHEFITATPGFDYVSRPGDGQVRYVFQDKVCIGLNEAYAHALELRNQKQ